MVFLIHFAKVKQNSTLLDKKLFDENWIVDKILNEKQCHSELVSESQ